jgi:hypothetical protein
MMLRIAAFAVLLACVGTGVSSAQTASSSPLTAGFTTFLTDVLGGRVPPNISPTMKDQAPKMLDQVQKALAPMGTFRRLQYERQDTMQGYRRYHYMAIFDQGQQGLIFVTDSKGVIVGFFEDQPAQ